MQSPAGSATALGQALSRLALRDHLCLIYETQDEQFAAVIPFVRMGLERGEQCLYIADESTVDTVFDAMRAHGIDVDVHVRSGALSVVTKREAYLKDGYFDPDGMIRLLTEAVGSAKAAGFKGLRATGEMTWALGAERGVDRLIEYEAKLNYFFPKHDAVAICQYNRRRFPAKTILDIIRTHPLVIYGGLVCRNAYYVPPDEFLQPNRPGREVERLLGNILDHERLSLTLQHSEERFRSLLDATAQIVWTTDPRGMVRWDLPAWREYTGQTLAEIQDSGWSAALHPDDAGRVREAWRQAVTERAPYAIEYRIRRHDGEYRWFAVRGIPVFESDGSIREWVGACTDITEEKLAGQKIRAAALHARSLIEASLDPLVTIGPDGRITDVNAATEQVTGCGRAELIGTDFCDYFTEPEKAREGYQQVFREGFVRDYSLELRHRDGRSISVLYNASVYRDEAGRVIGVFAAARDVTERRRAEETLRRSETELRQLAGRLELETARLNEAQAVAQIGSWDLDLRTNILTWSEECFRIFDVDQRRFGASYEAFLERVHPEDRAMVNKAYTDSVANHTPYVIDHRLIRADGSVRCVHERCYTYYDDAGRPLRSVGTAQDITERKEADEALRTSERKYRALIKNLQTAVVVHAADTRIITCNSVAQDLLGLSEGQLLGRSAIDPAWRFLREDGTPMPPAEYPVNQVMASRQPLRNFIVGVHRPDNPEEVWVIVNANPAFGRDGGISEVIVTFIDVTERQRHLEKINHLAAIVESSDDAIIGKGLDERIVSWNKGAERIYGYAAAEVIGQPISILVPPALKAELHAIMERLRRGELVERLETTRRRKDGQTIHVALTISPIKDARGRIVGASTIARDITERIRADEALRRSREEVQDLYDHAPCGYHSLGPDGTFTRINGTELAWLGYTREEVVGKMKFSDLITPRSREIFQREFPGFKQRGWVRDLTFEVVRKDGSVFPASLNAVAIYDDHGGYLMSRSVLQDITERLRSEEVLRRASAYNRSLIEASLDPLVTIGSDGKITDANAATEAVIGCGRVELIGTDFSDYFTEPEKAREGYQRVFARGYVTDYPLTIRNRHVATVAAGPDSAKQPCPRCGRFHGALTDVLYNASVYRDEAGQVIGVFAAARDVTELKRAEERILERERHSQSLLRLSRALERSQTYAEALTAARGEVRATLGYQSLWVYLLTPDRTRLKALMADGALGPTVMSEEGTATLTVQGDRMLEEIVAAKDIVVVEDARTDPRTDKASVAKSGAITIVNIPIVLFGRHFGVLGTGTTGAEGVRPPTPAEREYLLALASHMAVTIDRVHLLAERKRAEDEVRRLNAELEQRVAGRTRELMAANQELEAFSYSVSHDLRAPLRSIDGFSRILLEEYTGKLDEEGRDSLRRLRGASQRMGELIDQILKLSRTTRGELRFAPVDLSALAREIIAELQIANPGRQVEWVVAPDVSAVADAGLLRVVLQNLLDNALKFTGRRPQARIEFGVTATPEGERTFFVRDDGAGFDMTYADKLFSPFQRMHTAAEFPGTGIGLATVQRIIRRHGGKVWAESRVDAGTTFYFTLPSQLRQP